MRTPRFLLLLAVALATLFPLLLPGPAHAHHDSIEGLWSLVDEILDACPTGNTVRTVIDLKMFAHDGNMIETPGTPGVGAPPLKRAVPGLGSWRHVGGRHYTASFRFFRYNGSDDSFAGTQTADVAIELGNDGCIAAAYAAIHLPHVSERQIGLALGIARENMLHTLTYRIFVQSAV